MTLNKIIFVIIAIVIVAGIFTIPTFTEQFADANSRKKIHFTQTISSSQDPGQGHENHQFALVLSPNKGTMYDGSMTYTASKPVQLFVLHEITNQDSKGQPTWTVDGKTIYGLSLIDPNSNTGSFEFTGAAVALHSSNAEQFTATVSVDGWIRGQPTEVLMQKFEIEKEESPSLKLSRANVPATIPLHIGSFNGESVYYIITDSNGSKHAELISEKQNWKVELAPTLSDVPEEALSDVYMFTNGIRGDGIHGFQHEVFSSTPAQPDEYSALRSVTHVSWKPGQNAEVLDSVEAILEAKDLGRIELERTEAILNMSQIIWPEGQMIIKEEMTVTFIAHRGWGPDGRTIYYIVTDATPSGTAEMMGVTYVPTLENLITNSAAVDLFQFKNGIIGSGPLGFQPGIAAAAAGDETYSPMWRIYMVEWNEPENASILETKNDIDSFQEGGLVTVSLARPMNSDHIVNCPFIDPFQ